MIRDRGPDFTAAFDAVLADAGIRTVLCNIQTPRMNAIAERWIGGCRRELLDRTLIWNQAHLRQILRQYETGSSCGLGEWRTGSGRIGGALWASGGPVLAWTARSMCWLAIWAVTRSAG